MKMRYGMGTTWFVLFVPLLGAADEPSKSPTPGADRVKLVRQMYQQLPSAILDLAEPVAVINADDLERDGGWTRVTLQDAKGKKMLVQLAPSSPEDTKTPNALFIPGPKPGLVLQLPARGPEESAVYGLLLRWSAKPPEKAGKDVVRIIRNVLEVLDRRFAAELPREVKKDPGK